MMRLVTQNTLDISNNYIKMKHEAPAGGSTYQGHVSVNDPN